MEKHATILGGLYLGLSILGIIGGMICFALLAGIGLLAEHAAEEAPPPGGFTVFFSALGIAIGGFLVLISIPGIINGIGLIKHRPWSRVLTIVLSFLNIINFPLGTALGIYGLWVTMSDEGIKWFAQLR
jgi:hypothetical protein